MTRRPPRSTLFPYPTPFRPAPAALADLTLHAGEDTSAILHVTATTSGLEGATSTDHTISLTVSPVAEPHSTRLNSSHLHIAYDACSTLLSISVTPHDSDYVL